MSGLYQAKARHEILYHTARKKRRWYSAAFSFMLSGVLVWGVILLLDPISMPIKSVRLVGQWGEQLQHIKAEEVQNAVLKNMRRSFFLVNVAAVQQTVALMPWVAQADVRRVWPDTLQIMVKERVAAARWGEQGLISETGVVFYPEMASIPVELAQLRGPPGSEQRVLDYYRQFQAALKPLTWNIREVEMNARGNWLVYLTGGLKLVLSDVNTISRLQHFVQAMEEMGGNPQEKMRRVDLRYHNGFAVEWR